MEDEFAQHKTHQTKRILDLEKEMTVLRADLAELKSKDHGVRTELNKTWDILVGDDDLGHTGLIQRVKTLERLVLIGLIVTSSASLATLTVILLR